jgi:hypothetical protein
MAFFEEGRGAQKIVLLMDRLTFDSASRRGFPLLEFGLSCNPEGHPGGKNLSMLALYAIFILYT